MQQGTLVHNRINA